MLILIFAKSNLHLFLFVKIYFFVADIWAINALKYFKFMNISTITFYNIFILLKFLIVHK